MADPKFVILVTTNPYKVREYASIFEKYAVKVQHVCADPEDYAWDILEPFENPSCIAVLADDNNLYKPNTHLVVDAAKYRGRVVNRCNLTVLSKQVGLITYTGSVEGTLGESDTSYKDVFGWDGHFVPLHLKDDLHHLRLKGVKNSARQQAISAFVEGHLNYKEGKALRWSPNLGPLDVISLLDATASVESFMQGNAYLAKMTGIVRTLADRSVHEGVFFRHKTSRRAGNYWLPGLNGGIPFTPKKDAIHEVTYLFHDLMHHLTPDLVFDGSVTALDARFYMIWRLMSEAYSLVLADMLFVHHLASLGDVEYDWDKRAIYPLYRDLTARGDSLSDILDHMVTYITTGAVAQFPSGAGLEAFTAKYEPFFSADWRWTVENWKAFVDRKEYASLWVERVGGVEMFRSVGLHTITDAKTLLSICGEDSTTDIARKIGTYWKSKLFDQESTLRGSPLGNAHRRFLLGQTAVYARYADVVRTDAGLDLILEVVRQEDVSEEDTKMARKVLKTYLKMLSDFKAISPTDALLYNEMFPHFDPFFVNYDDGSNPPLVEVLAEILG